MLETIRDNYDSNKHAELAIKPNSKAPSIPSKLVLTDKFKKEKHLKMVILGWAKTLQVLQDTILLIILSRIEHKFLILQLLKFIGKYLNLTSQETIIYQVEQIQAQDNMIMIRTERKFSIVSYSCNLTAQGGTSTFASSVPNCKDTKIKNKNPGPGTYTKGTEGH